jgi:hypothetical protein
MIITTRRHDEICRKIISAYEHDRAKLMMQIKMLEHRVSVQRAALHDRARDRNGRFVSESSHYEGAF